MERQAPQSKGEYQDWKARFEVEPQYQALAPKVSPAQSLSLQIGEARIQSGVSQEELASRLGVGIRQVRRIEKRPYNFSAKTLSRFVQALGPEYTLDIRVAQSDTTAPVPESEDQAQYRNVQQQLHGLKQEYDYQRLMLIRKHFPEIVNDAKKFLDLAYKARSAFYEPWEYFTVGEEIDEAGEIQDKYGVGWHRQWPSSEHIHPKTDLFYEASEILYERRIAELRAKAALEQESSAVWEPFDATEDEIALELDELREGRSGQIPWEK